MYNCVHIYNQTHYLNRSDTYYVFGIDKQQFSAEYRDRLILNFQPATVEAGASIRDYLISVKFLVDGIISAQC